MGAPARGACRVPVAVSIHICVPGDLYALVNVSIAVVIGCVTDLDGARVACGIQVVAVVAAGDKPRRHCAGALLVLLASIPIPVGVPVPGGGAGHVRVRVIHPAVAVVVDAVADLWGGLVHGSRGVVAVGVVVDVSCRGCAGLFGVGGIAIAVCIGVCIPDLHIYSVVLVHGAIAVVVASVADFKRQGMGARDRVVALLAGGKPVSIFIDVAHGAIAVVVRGVRAVLFLGARVNGRVQVVAVFVVCHVPRWRLAAGLFHRRIAVAVSIEILVPGGAAGNRIIVIVHQPIAVVVQPVASLHGARVHLSVVVIAVGVAGEPVAIGVHSFHLRVCGRVAGVDGPRFDISCLLLRVIAAAGGEEYEASKDRGRGTS